MKTNESGYARLIANFENLYSHCLGFGAAYNPSYPAIQASGLGSKLGSARSALNAVQLAKTTHDDATNAREILFSGVKKMATRIINALIASNAVQQRIDDARSINRKLNGKRAGSITGAGDTSREAPVSGPGSVPAPVSGATEGPGRISVSHQGFDSLVENFAQLVVIAAAEPLFNPNEDDLKVTALNDFVNQLRAANTAVINTGIQYENARITRDTEFYDPNLGIINLARQVKTYVKSLFGASSSQFRSISTLRLT